MAEPRSIWCLVANVTREPHPEGKDRGEGLGVKHFAPGAKLYVYPPLWGDGGEKVKVIGRHRGGSKLVEIIIASKWLTNWRVQQVFHPHVVGLMSGYWDDTEESRARAIRMAVTFNGPGSVPAWGGGKPAQQ